MIIFDFEIFGRYVEVIFKIREYFFSPNEIDLFIPEVFKIFKIIFVGHVVVAV